MTEDARQESPLLEAKAYDEESVFTHDSRRNFQKSRSRRSAFSTRMVISSAS